ncbi:WD40 repeat domain-containing protein, partial [Limnothrix redekei]
LKRGHNVIIKEIKDLRYTCKITINRKTTIYAELLFSNNPFKKNRGSQVYLEKELKHQLANEIKIEYADWSEDESSWKVIQQQPERLVHHINKVRAGCFSLDSQYIATGSDDCSVKLWDLDGNCISTLIGHTALVSHLQFLDETVLLSASNDGTIVLRDVKEKKRMQIQAHSSYITAVDYCSERGLIATASEDRTVAIWTLHGKKISQIESNGQLYTQI